MWLHVLIIVGAIAASLALVLTLVKKKGGLSEFSDLSQIEKTHFILGIIVLSWTGLQVLTGVMTRLLQVFSLVHPAVILTLNLLHKILGYILVLLAKSTCLVGWWMFSKIGFWVVLGWCILMTLLYFFRWTLMPILTNMSHSFLGYPKYDS